MRPGVGEPLLRQWPVGDDDELVSGGRVAVPAVRGVEQVTADHRDLDGVPEGLDVVGGRPRDLERPAALPGGQLGVAVAVPVEQRPDRVIGIGDVAVHRTTACMTTLANSTPHPNVGTRGVRRFHEERLAVLALPVSAAGGT